jgi:hypothetical protein
VRAKVGSEAESMSRVVTRLRQQFPELSADAVEQAVYGRYDEFDGRPIRDFVPILVERSARQDLSAGQRAIA